jgi:hypothetical protein
MKKQKLATALFLCGGLVFLQGNKSQAVVNKGMVLPMPPLQEVVESAVSEEKESGKVVVDINDPFYCQLPTKNLSDNYALIEADLDRSTQILFGGAPNQHHKDFLMEVAMVESRLGFYTSTYIKGGTKGKGVWQIQRNAFRATKNVANNPQLKPFLERFRNETGIDWVKDVKWEHCNYVFYGAVAAQLYLVALELEPKSTTAQRAKQWKVHYNTYRGKGKPQDYIRKAARIEYIDKKSVPAPDSNVTDEAMLAEAKGN